MTDKVARVLVIAGSDSGGGAGVQGDIKTLAALGVYGSCSVTAVTVQNTLGVAAIHNVPPTIVIAQAEAVLADIGADAIKLGMLGGAAAEVADLLDAYPEIPAVVDPVMTAKGGAALAVPADLPLMKSRLMRRAALFTPNAPEAAALTSLSIETTDDLRRAGDALLALGCRAVLMKGGHVAGDRVVDILLDGEGETVFESRRSPTRHTHGTGCALASACTAGLAQGLTLPVAVARAHAYVAEAIARAPGLGGGAGPLGHEWTDRRSRP